MIAAIGLLYLDEESTFWYVRAIITILRTISEKNGSLYIEDKNRLSYARICVIAT